VLAAPIVTDHDFHDNADIATRYPERRLQLLCAIERAVGKSGKRDAFN
jgi:hypothetical protein